MDRRVEFYSEGVKLSGVIHLPDDHQPGQRRYGIVACHGFAQTRAIFAPRFAEQLVSHGFVVLTFDYRGFGESEGARWRLIPTEQVEDIKNAITLLQQQPEVNPEGIGLFGASFGGGNVIYTAAEDRRAKCVASVVPVGNGETWLHCIRRQWEWDALLKQLEEDRVTRALTGKSRYVDLHEIEVPDAELKAAHAERARQFPDWECKLPLETAERVISFRPDDMVHKIAPRPLLLIHSQKDTIVPLDQALNLYARAGEPKKLVVLPTFAHHYDLYQGAAFEAWMRVAAEWFQHHLSQPDPYLLALPQDQTTSIQPPRD